MKNNPTRRIVLRTGLGAAAGATLAASAVRAQDEKIAQELVQYQDQPKEGQQCNKCAQWVEPNACKIVVGKISPQGYCVAYAPKEG
jgi:hypothetical protein